MYQVSEISGEISCGHRASLDDGEIARNFNEVVQAPTIPTARRLAREDLLRHKCGQRMINGIIPLKHVAHRRKMRAAKSARGGSMKTKRRPNHLIGMQGVYLAAAELAGRVSSFRRHRAARSVLIFLSQISGAGARGRCR
jgi:hypothetical protein